jgi:hypothetical protein
MPTPQDLGVKMAKTLLAELKVIPEAQHLEGSRLQIEDPIPSDGKFFEYKKNKVKIEPTKEALLQYMLGDRKSIVAFCCASLQVDPRLSFDIDHVFPRECITEKQKLLLDYLNDPNNDAFARAFMGEDPIDKTFTQEIGKYFKRDHSNSKIKGTRWFFDVCYNNLSNLFHLKNYLNRGKLATTPQKWFEQNFQPKLPRFMVDMNEKGGINEGVIMQQIFPTIVGGTKLDSISLGKVKDKNNREVGDDIIVYLHEGKGIGLGEFVRSWFKTNAELIEISREIYEIKNKLTEMLEDDLRDNGEKEGLEKFLLTINEALQLAKDRSKLGRASSEDSAKAGESRKKVSYKSLLKAFDFMHSVKQIKKQILANVEAAHKDAVQDDFYDDCIENWFELPTPGLKIATDYIAQQCELKKQSGSFFTADEIKALIVTAGQKGDPEERLKEEAKKRQDLVTQITNIPTDIANDPKKIQEWLNSIVSKQQADPTPDRLSFNTHGTKFLQQFSGKKRPFSQADDDINESKEDIKFSADQQKSRSPSPVSS